MPNQHRRRLTVREHEEISVALADMLENGRVSLYPEVQRRDYLQVRLAGDQVAFAAGSFVGVIPLNDRVEIEVIPKVPIANLNRLVRLARGAPVVLETFRRWYHPYRDDLRSVLDLVAASFIAAFDEVLRGGLHWDYIERTENTSHPRGQILVTKTVRLRARSSNHLVGVSWYEPSFNTLPNRLLKFAIDRLAHLLLADVRHRGRKAMLRRLESAFLDLELVELSSTSNLVAEVKSLDLGRLSSRWAHYASATSLALLVLEGQGVDLLRSGERVTLPSLLVNMSDVFEAYVREVLRSSADRFNVQVLDGNLKPPQGAKKALFVDAPDPPITPDIVIRSPSAVPLLLGDVKYKSFVDLPPREDLSQVISYALSYGANSCVLVHTTSDDASALHRLGRLDGVTVYRYRMNLNGNLETEERALTDAVLGIVATARAAA